MNKPQKPPQGAQGAHPEPPPVSRLDEKISKLTIEFGKFLKKIWLPAVLVLGICLIGFLLYLVMLDIHGSREDRLVNELMNLLDPKEAKEQKFAVKEPELDRLVQDSQGSDSERYILKHAVSYLKLKSSKDPKDDDFNFESPAGAKPPAPVEDAAQVDRMLAKIEQYAKAGQERFPKDEDMQAWAANATAWVKSEREFKSRTIEKRSFAPAVPSPTAPSTAPPTPTATPAPAPNASPSASPPEGPKTEPSKTGAQPDTGK